MDKTDQRLVAALRRNARASVSELAGNLGVSRATVRKRMDRLLANGEILGFTVILKGDHDDLPVRGVTLVAIEGKGQKGIVSELSGFAEVRLIHTTNGRWDLVVELGAQTLADLDHVLNRIRLIDGVVGSDTSLYLSTRRSGQLPAAAG